MEGEKDSRDLWLMKKEEREAFIKDRAKNRYTTDPLMGRQELILEPLNR
jgi:hypothetical protein